MLQILLLAVQALPAYVPYNDQVVPIDYDSATGRLAVGTQEKYVSKVVEAARWANLTSVNQPVGRHIITGWRAGKHTKGVYLTHTIDGQNWKTYVPDIDNFSAVTAANLDSLLAMYNAISQSPGMQTKDLVDFVVPLSVKTFLETEKPSTEEIIAVLALLNPTLRALKATDSGLGHSSYEIKEKTEHESQEENLFSNQRDKLEDAEARLYSKTPAILTPCIAAALQESNSAAIKEFLEFFFQQSNIYKNVDINGVISKLVQKIGGFTSLDLSMAVPTILGLTLAEYPEFLRLFTSLATLSTLTSGSIFKELLEKIISLFKKNIDKSTLIEEFPEKIETLNPEKERALQAQQSANRKLYAEAFVRVVTEMKRRFDTAVSKPAAEHSSFKRTEKEELVGVAKRVWTNDYARDETIADVVAACVRVEKQKQIRAISPEAAQILEEMASVPD